MRRSLMCAALLSTFLPAVAQMRVCMGGNLDTLSAAERRGCEEQVARARTAADDAHAPADWHFVVVCGEDGWKDYMAFSNTGESTLANASADTDVANKTTFLRGTRMTTLATTNEIVSNALQPQARGVELAQK